MRRFETGSLVAALGAMLLLVSLFLEWFQPDLTAWDAFEVWDLVLAGLALAVLAIAAGELGWWGGPQPPVEIVVAGVGAVIVVACGALINHPPAAIGRGVKDGAWLGLAGAVLMAAGGAMARFGVSFSMSVGPKPVRRVPVPDGSARPGRAGRGRTAPPADVGPPSGGTRVPAARPRFGETPAPHAAPPPGRAGMPGAGRPSGVPGATPPAAGPRVPSGAPPPSPAGRRPSRRPGRGPAAAPPGPRPDGDPPAASPDTSRRWRPGRRAAPSWDDDETEITRPLPGDPDAGPPPPR